MANARAEGAEVSRPPREDRRQMADFKNQGPVIMATGRNTTAAADTSQNPVSIARRSIEVGLGFFFPASPSGGVLFVSMCSFLSASDHRTQRKE